MRKKKNKTKPLRLGSCESLSSPIINNENLFSAILQICHFVICHDIIINYKINKFKYYLFDTKKYENE